MFCSKCGKEISDGAKFCNFCGHKTIGESQTKEKSQKPEDKTEEKVEKKVEEKPTQNSEKNVEQKSEQNKDNNNFKYEYEAKSVWDDTKKANTQVIPPVGAATGSSQQKIYTSNSTNSTQNTQNAQNMENSGNSEVSAVQPQQQKTSTGLIVSLIIAACLAGITVTICVLFAMGIINFNNESDNQPVQQEQTTSNVVNKSSGNMSVSQVDSGNFPDVTIYATFKDSQGNKVDNIDATNFEITEKLTDGTQTTSICSNANYITDSDELDINLVMDKSGSMDSSNKISQAKTAAKNMCTQAVSRNATNVELTTFEDKVYNTQPYTNNITLLESAINSIQTTGSTALYDALYWALQRSALRTNGARVVVAFTDGEENASKYTKNEVVELSKKTGIPVYLIGVGSDVKSSALKTLATECKGEYYDCSVSNMSTTLSKIYSDIFTKQKSLCKFKFVSQNQDNLYSDRQVTITCKDNPKISASCTTTYTPQNDISLYDNKAVDEDYVLPDSNSRIYSQAELEKMSIWDLYLARNEIYARHGRDFKHQDLKQYFATKSWYSVKYTPEQFDAIQNQVFNEYEKKNAETMLQIERSRNSPYLAP